MTWARGFARMVVRGHATPDYCDWLDRKFPGSWHEHSEARSPASRMRGATSKLLNFLDVRGVSVPFFHGRFTHFVAISFRHSWGEHSAGTGWPPKRANLCGSVQGGRSDRLAFEDRLRPDFDVPEDRRAVVGGQHAGAVSLVPQTRGRPACGPTICDGSRPTGPTAFLANWRGSG